MVSKEQNSYHVKAALFLYVLQLFTKCIEDHMRVHETCFFISHIADPSLHNITWTKVSNEVMSGMSYLERIPTFIEQYLFILTNSASLSTFWNECGICFFVVWYVEMLQSNSLSLDNFFCSSGKCFGRRHCGFVPGLFSALSLGTQSSHFSLPILSFSLFHPPVFLISRLPFPLNKWRNAGAYFLNLGRGEVPVWLTGKRAGKAKSLAVGSPDSVSSIAAGKPKNKNNTGRFYWNEFFLHCVPAFISLGLYSISSVSYFSHYLLSPF